MAVGAADVRQIGEQGVAAVLAMAIRALRRIDGNIVMDRAIVALLALSIGHGREPGVPRPEPLGRFEVPTVALVAFVVEHGVGLGDRPSLVDAPVACQVSQDRPGDTGEKYQANQAPAQAEWLPTAMEMVAERHRRFFPPKVIQVEPGR